MNFITTIADKIREAVKQAFLKLLEYLTKLFKGGDSNLLIPKQTSDDGTVSVWVIKDKVTKQPVVMLFDLFVQSIDFLLHELAEVFDENVLSKQQPFHRPVPAGDNL